MLHQENLTEVLVVGTYNLNPRVKIFIHLVVTV